MKKYILKNLLFIVVLTSGTFITSMLILSVPFVLSLWNSLNLKFDYRLYTSIILLMGVSLTVQLIVISFRESFAVRMNINNSVDLFRKMFRLKYNKFVELGSSYLVDRISSFVNALYLFLSSSLSSIVSGVIVCFVSIVIISSYNIIMGCLLLLIIPVNYFGYKHLNKKLLEKSITMQSKTSQGYQKILALVNNADFIKQYGYYKSTEKYLEYPLREIFESIKDVNIYAQTASTLLKYINIFSQNIIVLVISLGIIENNNELISIVIVSSILPIFFNSLSTIVSANLSAHEIKGGISFISEILDNHQERLNGRELTDVNKITIKYKSFEINGINFEFNGDTEFEIGDVVYISGLSGAGKSTFLKIMSGFYELDLIKINEIDLKEYSIESIRNCVIYVSQDSTLLPISIVDNINIGMNSNVSYNISSDIGSIFKGRLNDKVYDGGKNLSGGEKQRIHVARALANNPKVLLLDEVTSNIDKKSSSAIFQNVIKNTNNSIIFITSHDDKVRMYCNKEISVIKQSDI